MDERETFRLAKILDKNNIDQAEDIIDKAAAQHKLDKETYRLLKTFQDEFLMVSGISVAYIDHLKQHELVLKRMGSVFKSLGLARRVKGAEFAWKPKNMLREIIGERAGGPPDRDVKIDKWNEAIIESCWKVANVADFILGILCALGLEERFDDRSIQSMRMRQILVTATVKQGSKRVLNIRGSCVRATKYLSLSGAQLKTGREVSVLDRH
jgi:hypothetical protein